MLCRYKRAFYNPKNNVTVNSEDVIGNTEYLTL
jgi:hypothetical protein